MRGKTYAVIGRHPAAAPQLVSSSAPNSSHCIIASPHKPSSLCSGQTRIFSNLVVMDPLSVTASVVGITTAALQSAQFLAKTIDNVKDAPVTMKNISADLRTVEPILQSLKRELQGNSLQIMGNDQIRHAVENCDRACTAFQSRIEHWTRHSTEDRTFWIDRWKIGLFEQERIKTFKGQLNDCKGTLSVALSTATMYASPIDLDRPLVG